MSLAPILSRVPANFGIFATETSLFFNFRENIKIKLFVRYFFTLKMTSITDGA